MSSHRQEIEKLSIAHCKKVLNKNGYNYTDEQVEKIRDFLYILADIELQNLKKIEHEEESNSLHPRID